jgi:predicted component of type VI protein secretion system
LARCAKIVAMTDSPSAPELPAPPSRRSPALHLLWVVPLVLLVGAVLLYPVIMLPVYLGAHQEEEAQAEAQRAGAAAPAAHERLSAEFATYRFPAEWTLVAEVPDPGTPAVERVYRSSAPPQITGTAVAEVLRAAGFTVRILPPDHPDNWIGSQRGENGREYPMWMARGTRGRLSAVVYLATGSAGTGSAGTEAPPGGSAIAVTLTEQVD